MHLGSINQHASEMYANLEVHMYYTKLSQRRKGIWAPQSAVGVAFMDRYADENALMCQTGIGATSERPLQLLQSEVTREGAYKYYEEKWKEMMELIMGNVTRGLSTA